MNTLTYNTSEVNFYQKVFVLSLLKFFNMKPPQSRNSHTVVR